VLPGLEAALPPLGASLGAYGSPLERGGIYAILPHKSLL
jgi:hypothetical protein